MQVENGGPRLGTWLALVLLGACALLFSGHLFTGQVVARDGQACGSPLYETNTAQNVDGVTTTACDDARDRQSRWALVWAVVGVTAVSVGVLRLNLIGRVDLEVLAPTRRQRRREAVMRS